MSNLNANGAVAMIEAETAATTASHTALTLLHTHLWAEGDVTAAAAAAATTVATKPSSSSTLLILKRDGDTYQGIIFYFVITRQN